MKTPRSIVLRAEPSGPEGDVRRIFIAAQDFLGQTLKMEQPGPVIVTFGSDWDIGSAELHDLSRDHGKMASRIGHIGSTTIPLLPAKGIIEFLVSVNDLALAPRLFDHPPRFLGYQFSLTRRTMS